MIKTYEWMVGASCRDKQSLFFNESVRAEVKQAVQICQGCAVKEQCLSHALEHREIGVWGGLTTNQRAKMLRRKRANNVNIAIAYRSNVGDHGEEDR